MSRIRTTLFTLSAIACLLGPAAVSAHEDHDHGPPPAPVSDIPRLESVGSEFELVATAAGHDLKIYLDRSETNEPVDGAKIEVETDGVPAATATPAGHGVYELDADWLEQPGTKAVTFTVTVGQSVDLLAGTFDIHAGSAAEVAPKGWKDIFARPELWLAGLLLFLAGFFVSFAFRPARIPSDEHADRNPTPKGASVEPMKKAVAVVCVIALSGLIGATRLSAHEGHDHGGGEPAAPSGGETPRKLPTGEVFVPKSSQRLLRVRTKAAVSGEIKRGVELMGMVVSEPSSMGRVQAPMAGQIEVGEKGVSFVGQSVAAGDVLATLAPMMPVYDRGTLLQQLADVVGKIKLTEQKLARLQRIASVVAEKEILDAKTELEALKAQREVLSPQTDPIVMRAPVGGVISVANVRAGQVVDLRETLFEIVDPKRVWVEAIGYPSDDGRTFTNAHAIDSDGHSIPLKYVGRAPMLRQQSLPILFHVETPHAGLAIGATVKVVAQTDEAAKGIALPTTAITRGANGLPQVWQKLSPETFKALPVTVSPIDGAQVLVTAGVEPGTRIVVEGAELINQIR